MSVTEQRDLKLAVDFEGTTTNGIIELSLNKGLRTLYAHASLGLAKSGSSKNRKNEVVHDVVFSNMRVETRRDESGSSTSIRKSFSVAIPAINMPSHLIGLEGATPAIMCHDGIPASLDLPFNVDEKTLNRVAGSQGWTKGNIEDAYTSTAKGVYVIKVQDMEKGESMSPVLRAYLGATGKKYTEIVDDELLENGITGVSEKDLNSYVSKAKKWMDEIPTSSLSLRDLKLLVKTTNQNADAERIKISGTITISYSTLGSPKAEKPTKSSRKASVSSSKKLSHRNKRHYGSDDDSSSSSSSSSSSDHHHHSSDESGSGSDEEDDDIPVRSSILKKKGQAKSSRSARVK